MDQFDMWDTSMLPKKGDTDFVHYFHEPVTSDKPCKMDEPEGIIYTVKHVTDGFVHQTHISDFVTMG